MREKKHTNLYQAARACFCEQDLARKLRLTHATARDWRAGKLPLTNADTRPSDTPGRPECPVLVAPRELPRRRAGTLEGRAALLHALAHIEFNAVNLAWDAVQRFHAMPRAYYDDWVRVADEEALHFRLLHEHLNSLAYVYGDFPAHNGLWEVARDTAHDCLARMALVPRTMEARGLDVTPAIMEKLRAAGDPRAVEILEIILRDEIDHVAAGSRWFHYLCEQRGLEPEKEFRRLQQRYLHSPQRPPFYEEARRAAGFSETELAELREGFCS